MAAVGQVLPGDGSWPVHVGLSTAFRWRLALFQSIGVGAM
ncbi:hypothetical protein RISK_001219 [Rhodopirellula islandica]|uniref:Uncharacterized protein n=1 Tax=Rhodopirellula islandica TaxID=595434 RepID=A0A0J1BJK3_RHOIS|nr:hypothetical protein RISK_001219 [Rhodopirellula islandica]